MFERKEKSSGGDRGDRGDRGGDRGDRGGDGGFGSKRGFGKRKVCRFCVDKIPNVDHKDLYRILNYVSERGKIVPARISGACARHQRQVTRAVKFNRTIGLAQVGDAPSPMFGG